LGQRVNFEAPLYVYDHLYHNELKDGADPNLPLPGDRTTAFSLSLRV
jgi:hypothetical protein